MKSTAIQVLVLLALSLLATAVTWKLHPNPPALYLNAEPLGEGEVSIEKAMQWQREGGVIWIDARKAAEFEKAHVPDAILLNEFDFDHLLFESYDLIANKDEKIVIYCGSYRCKASTKVADRLREKRLQDVYVLKGGWEAWAKANGQPGS
ncbi:MAG: rhodanese-related sulfurtransferase [Pseudoalteromonas tetraodonis]|jgi:rhodanese-related sulfurtransferase